MSKILNEDVDKENIIIKVVAFFNEHNAYLTFVERSQWSSFSAPKNSQASKVLFPSKEGKFLKARPRPRMILAPLEES